MSMHIVDKIAASKMDVMRVCVKSCYGEEFTFTSDWFLAWTCTIHRNLFADTKSISKSPSYWTRNACALWHVYVRFLQKKQRLIL